MSTAPPNEQIRHAGPAVGSRWLTVEQTAEVMQVPVREVRALIDASALAHVKIGRHTRIHPQAIEDWRRRNEVRAWSAPGTNEKAA